ncbi:MAG: hypothetical protein KDN19_03850 [Verrucomicrobiae bacterium]|nr:hypothetical protein [Verrucomicrobiae bacterium]
MKTRKPAQFWANVALLALTLSLSGIARGESELREFSNSDGKTIKARLVAATDQTAKLQLEGGREIEAGVTYFSEADQKYIAEWRKLNKPEIDYKFEIDYNKKRKDRETHKEGQVEVTYETWYYEVEVENLSGTDLDGLEMQYKIYKTANADANDARYRAEGLEREGPFLVRKGKVELKPLPYLKSASAETETIPISKSQLDGGFYYVNGDKSNKKDDIDGFWVKIFHQGKEVYEVKSSHSAVKNAKW